MSSTSTWAIGRFWGSIRDVWKEINPATLTGAVDVVVVEQPNGDLVCSPFHVRFGKMGVLRSKEKVVDITINEVPSSIQMKLSDMGEAFFIESVEGGDEVPMHLATSPLPVSGLELMKRGLDSLRSVESEGQIRESSAPPGVPIDPQSSDLSSSTGKILSEKEEASFTIGQPQQEQQQPYSAPPQQLQPMMRRQDTVYQSCTNELPGLDKQTLRKLLMTRRRSDAEGFRDDRGRSRSWHGETLRNGARRKASMAVTPSAPIVAAAASIRSASSKRKAVKTPRGGGSSVGSSLRHSRSYAPSASLRKVSYASPMSSTTSFRSATTSAGGIDSTSSTTTTSSDQQQQAAAGLVTRASSNWRTPPESTPNALTPSASSTDTHQKVKFTMTNNEDIFQMDDADDEGGDDGKDDDGGESRLSRSLGTSSVGAHFKEPVERATLEKAKEALTKEQEKKEAVTVAHAVDGALGVIIQAAPVSAIHEAIDAVDEEDGEEKKKRSDSDVPPSDNEDDRSRSPSPVPSNETEQEKLERVIKDGDALGKVLGHPGGSDSDTSVWRWARKNSEAKISDKVPANEDGQTGWNLFGFMRRQGAADRQQQQQQPTDPEGGIYLGDLLKDEKVDPQLADRYLTKRNWRRSEGGANDSKMPQQIASDPSIHPAAPNSPRSDQGYGSNPSSVIASDDHRRWFFDEGRFQELLGDVSISSCGGLDKGNNEITDEYFNAHLVTYDQLNTNPDLLFSSDLVIKMNGKYYNWRVAGPMMVSLLLFQQPLSESAVHTLITKHQPKASAGTSAAAAGASTTGTSTHEARDTSRKNSDGTNARGTGGYSSYFWWRRATSADPPSKSEQDRNQDETNEPKPDSPIPDSAGPQASTQDRQSPTAMSTSSFDFEDRGALSDSELDESKRTTFKARFKKTLHLTSDQLKSLNLLRGGPNKACFSVTTKYQGTTYCECEIWLYRYDDKIIISDVDGTITKSDVLGHILPRVGGGHWAHIGVAELFNRIVANDYKILYLTARAIGMAYQTKEYLNSVIQDKFSLPGGPLLLSPTSVFNALHREVIEKKPEVFKTACLRDIVALFPPGINPFFAGFGNRPNDMVAYTAAGVPPNRIYIIDPTGRVAFTDQRLEFSYPRISDLVDHIFPPLRQMTRRARMSMSGLSPAPTSGGFGGSGGGGGSGTAITPAAPEEYNVAQFWRPLTSDVEIDMEKFPKPTAPNARARAKSSGGSTAANTQSGWTSKKK